MIPRIIYEDAHLMVLEKPAGLLSQGAQPGDPNLVDWLRQYLGRHYVGLVHRLDRNTSGLMVVAKRSKAANRLTEALQKGELHRKYLAWILGRLEKPQTWRHELTKDEHTNRVRVVTHEGPSSRTAVLRVEPKKISALAGLPMTLAEFTLETGRSHQIRVQAAHEGYPILGDPKYGKGFVSGPGMGLRRPALHSAYLRFPDPVRTGCEPEIRVFESALPEDMAQFLDSKPRS